MGEDGLEAFPAACRRWRTVMPTTISFSEDDVRKWEAEALTHETLAAELREKAQAARVFFGKVNGKAVDLFNHQGTPNLRAEIVSSVNSAKEPLTRADLRQVLEIRGVEKKRLNSSYFYIAI